MSKLLGKAFHIVIAVMPNSPFNRSIWVGFANAFLQIGHKVTVVDAQKIPAPASIGTKIDIFS